MLANLYITKPFKPWVLVGFLGFDNESKALKFEKYLKSNAGRIFLKRYFNDELKVLACLTKDPSQN